MQQFILLNVTQLQSIEIEESHLITKWHKVSKECITSYNAGEIMKRRVGMICIVLRIVRINLTFNSFNELKLVLSINRHKT